ncbi:hypothetical protein DSAG12_00582 [Promethearchaeum syntrophicum]|uniref:Uncharacterized protein n=1 Tax=Promethearchaeum syntrophicum TaxID=2594042 RepID=A0A5B9D841_9ARCH|nr:hypothetical protein [Candidatus Prometheoarchaeum syntrophicum]QEE14766.1 hypothetical protein DSAG12_00582 [Candidatus Prometheoarchaeum syntrophicum]
MANKTISIPLEIWVKMKDIKDDLNQKSDSPVHWRETWKYLLETFENGLKNPQKATPPPPKVPKSPKNLKTISGSTKLKKPKLDMSEIDLSIPPPPMKKAIKIKLNSNQLEELTKKETTETKYILIECQICGNTPIMMPVPKDLVLTASEPVVDVSYIHGDPEHVLVAQLDHDFQVRRRRASWVVYEKDYHKI